MFGGSITGGGGRIVTPDALRFPALAQVRAYWEALRRNGLPPFRSEIDPRGIADALECGFIVERVAPGVARFRIAGMHLADLMGMDVRGMPVLSLIDPPARTEFGRTLEAVFAGPATLELVLEADRGIGRPALEGRMLLLPLRRDDGAVALALGCLATEGAIGRAPRRFAVARRTMVPLAGPAVARVPEPGFAEPAALFAVRPPVGKPKLRLVKSDQPR